MMKDLLIVFSVLSLCSTVPAEEILSPGGPGADLSKAEIPGQGKAEGPNLFASGDLHDANEWRASSYIDPVPGLDCAALGSQLLKMSGQNIVTGENGHTYARVEIDDRFADLLLKNKGKTALRGLATSCSIGERFESEQELFLSFRYRGNSSNEKTTHGIYSVLRFSDGDRTLGSGWGQYALPLSASWRQAGFRVKAPAGTTAINLNMGLSGAGFCEFGDITIRKVPSAAQKLWVELYAMEAIDSAYFELREKCASAISIAPYGEKTGKWLNIYLALPKEINVIGHSMLLGSPRTAKVYEKVSEGAAEALYRINADQLFIKQGHYHWNCTLLLDNPLAADGKERTITYYAEDESGKTLPKTVKLVITKAEKSPAPKRFVSGGVFTSSLVLDNDAAENAIADMYADVGFNALTAPSYPIVRKAFMRKGVKMWAGLIGVKDAYIFGIDSSKKPDDILFMGKDGKPAVTPAPDRIYDTPICPVVIYTKSPYHENVIRPHFEKVFKEKSQDFFSPNWEPVALDYKGCFCARCRDEFIRYSGLPAETVKKAWPEDVLRYYRNPWVKFRSWQHVKVVEMVMGLLDEFSRKYDFPVEFAPELHFCCAKESSGFGLQYKLDDYLDKIRWLVPWGPYLYYDYSMPYVQNIGYHLHVWNQAGFNMKYVADRISEPERRPRLVALPNLQQPSKYYLTEPEAVMFETLTYFVRGWGGAFPYFLPIGVDNRYWNSFARANRQIAVYEDYVFDGEEFRDYDVSAVTPLPKNAVASWSYVKDVESAPAPDTSLLQNRAFRLDGKYLFAIGNFWENGECFFRLKVKGLDPSRQWHVARPDSWKSFGSFSASELEKGVVLHVGAMRWAFYVVASEKNAGCDTVVDQRTVASILDERLPKITRRYEADKAIIAGAAKRDKNAVNDLSGLREIKTGDVDLKPVGQMIQVKTPAYTAMLDLDHGAVLKSLKPEEGTEWAGEGGLGLTRFTSPDIRVVDNRFRLVGCEKMKNGSIMVKAEYRFVDGKVPKLAGQIVTKCYEFSKNSVRVGDTFQNVSDSEVALATSSHNFPAAFTFRGNETGAAKMPGAAHSRNGDVATFKIGDGRASALQELYNKSGRAGSAKEGPVMFTMPWSKIPIKAGWTEGDADFLACWDSFDMECATFEVHWKPFTLAPGAARTFCVSWGFN